MRTFDDLCRLRLHSQQKCSHMHVERLELGITWDNLIGLSCTRVEKLKLTGLIYSV